jgi:Pvc16 N-terminal domain
MSSIRGVLSVIRTLVNEYMQNLDRRGDDWVTLTSVVYHDGSVNEATRDKVVMTLYNISRENIISTYSPTKAGGDSFAVVQPPIYVNLHLMFMANFAANNYLDGLAAISHIISFFQQNPWFNQTNAPDLGPEIDKITMEMSNLDVSELNHLMGVLGTKYMPSAFYKLRMLPFASTAMHARTYPVAGGGISETPQSGRPQ